MASLAYPAPLRSPWRLRAAWLVPVLALPAAVVGLVALAGAGALPAAADETWVLTVLPLAAVAGAALLQASPAHPLGRLLLVVGAASAAALLTNGWAEAALDTPDPSAGAVLAGWVGGWVWALTVVPLVALLPLLLPDGRLPSPRWRVVAGAAAVSVGLLVAANALTPGDLPGRPGVDNPFGLPAVAAGPLIVAGAVGAVLVPVLGLVAVSGLVVRWRRSDPSQRERLRLVALSAVPLALSVVWSTVAPSGPATAAGVLSVVGWAGCVAAAAVQHRLFDVDVAISRTVVLVTVAVVLLGVHVGAVALLGGASLLATALVAVLFAPLRELVQRRVNAFLFGRRDDPWTSLVLLGHRAEAAGDARAALQDVSDVLLSSLRLSSVQVLLADGDADVSVATRGAPPGERAVEQALVHLGERIGTLRVAPRSGESLGRYDHALLADLAPAVAAVAATVLSTDRLRRSQQQLLTAVEEERRRLRRDLHDGVGPALTGVAFALEAARNVRPSDPTQADALLVTATADLHAAVADLRHAVEGLRPAALDDLGLVPAVEQRLRALAASTAADLSLHVPAALPALPAAVEVAAYRIALEGVANTVRHAAAPRCSVRLEVVDGVLHLQVRDDGRGLPQPLRLGTGLLSVRERAAALGGQADVRAGDPGTVLDVRLPLP